MLTDDELTTRLRSSFEHATTDLHYTRRVSPPRPRAALVVAPAVAGVGSAVAVAVAVAVGALVAGSPTASPSVPTHAASPTAAVTHSSPTRRVECWRCHQARIEFAGYVMTYRRSTAVSDDMAALVSDPVPVPSDARRVTNADGVVAAVAQYPGTAKQALWVTLSTRNGGRPMALVSQGLTADQLVDLWQNGKPYPQ